MSQTTSLLTLDSLSVMYYGPPDLKAVSNVSFEVQPGEILGLAGESGCGKSTLISAITRLLPPNGEVTQGRIRFCEHDWLSLSEQEVNDWRWTRLALVSQSAMNSLNPVISIGEQIVDAIVTHQPKTSNREAWIRAGDLLRLVEVDPKVVLSYPHELSGGMRQRAMIAMALALHPDLIIMDEPTTALDVVVQAQIIHQIRTLQERLGFSVIFVTHDMSLLLSVADRIAIMYAGEIVEMGPRETMYRTPSHPYTRGLISSFPSVFETRNREGIPGSPPSMVSLPTGCRFHPRCGERMPCCSEAVPGAYTVGKDHYARCHLLESSAADPYSGAAISKVAEKGER